MRLLFGIIAALGFLAFAGCGSNTSVEKVTIDLNEWSIKVDPATIQKGTLEFTINNDGQKSHELEILQTNIPPDKLPTKSDGSVDTGAADIKVAHTVDAIDGGDKTSRTFAMDAGTYVLISNLVDDDNGQKTAQYARGMYTSFTITEGSPSASASTSASTSATATVAISGASTSATPTKTP